MFQIVRQLLIPFMSTDLPCVIWGGFPTVNKHSRLQHVQCLRNCCYFLVFSACVPCIAATRRIRCWIVVSSLPLTCSPCATTSRRFNDGSSRVFQLVFAVVIGYVVSEGAVILWTTRILVLGVLVCDRTLCVPVWTFTACSDSWTFVDVSCCS